jgi:hypothetical protein
MNLDFMASLDLISRVHGLITTARFNVLKRRRHHKKTNTPRGAAYYIVEPVLREYLRQHGRELYWKR